MNVRRRRICPSCKKWTIQNDSGALRKHWRTGTPEQITAAECAGSGHRLTAEEMAAERKEERRHFLCERIRVLTSQAESCERAAEAATREALGLRKDLDAVRHALAELDGREGGK